MQIWCCCKDNFVTFLIIPNFRKYHKKSAKSWAKQESAENYYEKMNKKVWEFGI